MLKDYKKIYITGGSGLVGHNLIENKDISGCKIVAPSHSELELTDYNAVYEFIKKEQPDLIIHTAGKVGGIVANMTDMFNFFTENIVMGINLVRASKSLGVKNFLNLSSSCFYPPEAPIPIKEESVLTGSFGETNEGYALAKAAVLKMCEYVTRQFEGYNYKTLIPCSLYGRYDSFSPEKSHLIPAIISKIVKAKKTGEKTVEIWGDGESRRELMYAGDFAQIVVQVLDKFEQIPSLLNIGLGFDYTINDYYKAIAEVVDYDGKFTHDLSKPVGVKQKVLDISKQKEFGFTSKYTLRQGLEEIYKYYINEYSGNK